MENYIEDNTNGLESYKIDILDKIADKTGLNNKE